MEQFYRDFEHCIRDHFNASFSSSSSLYDALSRSFLLFDALKMMKPSLVHNWNIVKKANFVSSKEADRDVHIYIYITSPQTDRRRKTGEYKKRVYCVCLLCISVQQTRQCMYRCVRSFSQKLEKMCFLNHTP